MALPDRSASRLEPPSANPGGEALAADHASRITHMKSLPFSVANSVIPVIHLRSASCAVKLRSSRASRLLDGRWRLSQAASSDVDQPQIRSPAIGQATRFRQTVFEQYFVHPWRSDHTSPFSFSRMPLTRRVFSEHLGLARDPVRRDSRWQKLSGNGRSVVPSTRCDSAEPPCTAR